MKWKAADQVFFPVFFLYGEQRQKATMCVNISDFSSLSAALGDKRIKYMRKKQVINTYVNLKLKLMKQQGTVV